MKLLPISERNSILHKLKRETHVTLNGFRYSNQSDECSSSLQNLEYARRKMYENTLMFHEIKELPTRVKMVLI
jgi:hypothetical protein